VGSGRGRCGYAQTLPNGKRSVRLAYQPPATSTFFSEQNSYQQPISSTFLSEQISTCHHIAYELMTFGLAKEHSCSTFKVFIGKAFLIKILNIIHYITQ
jgi:hypothetical protein